MTELYFIDVLGVWLGIFITFCVLSFLYKDNPFYKFAEHLFVGVSAGYYIILNFWTVIVPNLWDPLQRAWTQAAQGPGGVPGQLLWMFSGSLGDYRGWLLLPGICGVLLFTRFVPKISWLSRWALAVIIGVYAGIKTTGFAQGDLVAQAQASLQPLWTGNLWGSLNNVIFTLGLLCSLVFFFFSKEHKGVLGGSARIGMFFLMVSFGAGYGYTVMSRISLLIGRFQFMLDDWLGVVRF
jgi:hypothetical protein